MDYSVTFARHFSRLVWLLLHQPENIDEQKAALRAVVTVSQDGQVTLATQDYQLIVNGQQLPPSLTGVQDLAAQLTGHAISQLVATPSAAPADLLGVARILAGEPVPGDHGRAVLQKLSALGATTVQLAIQGNPALRDMRAGGKPTPVTGAPAHNGASPADGRATPRKGTMASGEHRLPGEPSTGARRSGGIMEPRSGSKPMEPRSGSKPMEPRSGSKPMEPRSGSRPMEPRSGARPTPRSGVRPLEPRSGVRPGTPAVGPVGIINDESSGRYLAFAAVNPSGESSTQIIRKLEATSSPVVATRLLDELVTVIENAARDGRTEQVAGAFHAVVGREAVLQDGELKRAFAMAIRRLSKPVHLRMVAMMLPRRRDRLEHFNEVLTRTGEDGADALIEQLTAATSLSDRRIYFDSLVKLNAGVSALIHMLGDARWYVARNAADLLGEMQATEAEVPLTEVLKHDDDRVRRAAATALAKLGTPRAMRGLLDALKDSSAQVRSQAAAGLGSKKNATQAKTLLKALEEEEDDDVQLQILGALGRLATPDAVQKLLKAAEPGGALFNKKSVGYRVAAVQALGDAGTPAAIAALQELLADREKEVREAAFKAAMDAAQKKGGEPASKG